MPADLRVFVGLDLSLTGTGVGRIQTGGRVPAPDAMCMTIRSKGRTADSLIQRHRRLEDLAILIDDQVGSGPSWHVAVETPAHNQTSGHHHDRSGLWWMVVDRLLAENNWRQHEPIVHEVSTTQVKKYATGKGNASKMEVMAAAIKRYPQFDIANDNEADAVILAAFLARAYGRPIEESLPKAQIDVVDKWRASQVGTVAS